MTMMSGHGGYGGRRTGRDPSADIGCNIFLWVFSVIMAIIIGAISNIVGIVKTNKRRHT